MHQGCVRTLGLWWGIAWVVFAVPVWANNQGRVQELLHSADLRDTKVALFAVDLDSGEELFSIRADQPMIPASNMKLITTAAAIDILGLDYVFRTQLVLVSDDPAAKPGGVPAMDGVTSKPSSGAHLIIKTDGDPSFCDPVLLEEHGWDVEQLIGTWIQAVRDAGVDRVEHLVVDDRVFDQQFVHPGWPENQLHLWYCAQVAGLNFYGNCLDVFPEPTQPGQSPRVTFIPPASFIKITSRAVTGDTDSFWVGRKAQTNHLTLWGTIKNKRTVPVQVTVHDVPMYFARLLAERLTAAGVSVASVNRPGADERLPEGRALHVVQSTLPVVLRRCNKDSQNLFAEALFKRIGRKFTGSAGSWENGAAAVRAYLRRQLGAHSAAVAVSDGSGLSKDNLVTPRSLVMLLQKMHQDAQVGPVILESLSIGGVDGTLRKRFKRGLQGTIYAKSGYINGVSTLSGYLIVTGDTPRTFAFSFLFNGIKPPVYVHKVKKVQEDLLRIIDEMAATHSVK